MERLTSISAIRRRLATVRGSGARVALVATMGALHAGHLALIRMASEHADVVVVSIFVNPTQFDRADDLATYPRDLEGDERAMAALGSAAPAIVFAPGATAMYPREPLTTVRVARLTEGLCGASRPGHFDGVATVVTKLFGIVRPDVAVFGRKDAQQLQVIRRLVSDLDLSVEILPAPIVRESDGLALSSRNRRLSPARRREARALPAALLAAVEVASAARAAGRGPSVESVRAAALHRLVRAPGVDLEYLELVDPVDLVDLGTVDAPSRMLVALAARVGDVRLIDNVEVGDLQDERRLVRALEGSGHDLHPEQRN